MDEGAFKSEDLLLQCVLPVALRWDSSVAIITTPQGSDNYVSRLANIHTKKRRVCEPDENGRMRIVQKEIEEECIVNVEHLGGPCDDCIAKGRVCEIQ